MRPYFHHYSRAFADNWSGEGVDTELVDVEELKKAWSENQPARPIATTDAHGLAALEPIKDSGHEFHGAN